MKNDSHDIEPVSIGMLDPEQVKVNGIYLRTVVEKQEGYHDNYIEVQILPIIPSSSADSKLVYCTRALKTVLGLVQDNNNLPVAIKIAFPKNFSEHENDEAYRSNLQELEHSLDKAVVTGTKIVNIQVENLDTSSEQFSAAFLQKLASKFTDILKENVAAIDNARKEEPQVLMTNPPSTNISKSQALGLANKVNKDFVDPDSGIGIEPKHGSMEWRLQFGFPDDGSLALGS